MKGSVWKKVEQERQEKVLVEVFDKAVREAIRVMTYVSAISLHDEFGFGAKRIQKYIDKVKNQLMCIDSGTVTAQDIIRWCEERDIHAD